MITFFPGKKLHSLLQNVEGQIKIPTYVQETVSKCSITITSVRILKTDLTSLHEKSLKKL